MKTEKAVDGIGRLCAIAQTASSCTPSSSYATIPTGVGIGYNASNELLALNYGNGVAATLTYSQDRLQLATLKYAKGATTLFNASYSYGSAGSNNGQITKITDNVDNGRTVNYTYDNLARISTAVTTGSSGYPAWGLQWAYDQYGNRTSQTVKSGCTLITCPTNSLTFSSSGGAQTNRPDGYSFDNNGNMLGDGTNTITYDAENRAITSAGGLGSGGYVYDGNNLRVKKCVPNCTSPTTTTVYVFSGSSVVAEYANGAAPTSPTREYIYSGSALLAKIESGATQYYHLDLLSARLMTDSNGTKVGEQAHFPFGETWYSANTTTKWQFTDYERDSESGNDYAYARMYLNRLGRFSAIDPLGGSVSNPQSLNRYTYSLSDPIGLSDPSGLCSNGDPDAGGRPGPFAVGDQEICTSAETLGRGDGFNSSDILWGVSAWDLMVAGIVTSFSSASPTSPAYGGGATWQVDPQGIFLATQGKWGDAEAEIFDSTSLGDWSTMENFVSGAASGGQNPANTKNKKTTQKSERLERLKNCALGYYGIDPLSAAGLASDSKWLLIAAGAGGYLNRRLRSLV